MTVLYLYEFTLLSNRASSHSIRAVFYTSMNLHYSQTLQLSYLNHQLFYTSMNLHYSQTVFAFFIPAILFYTSMNLHYSQT